MHLIAIILHLAPFHHLILEDIVVEVVVGNLHLPSHTTLFIHSMYLLHIILQDNLHHKVGYIHNKVGHLFPQLKDHQYLLKPLLPYIRNRVSFVSNQGTWHPLVISDSTLLIKEEQQLQIYQICLLMLMFLVKIHGL